MKKFLKNFVLQNCWSDFEIISQECTLGDFFQKLFAKFQSVYKYGSGARFTKIVTHIIFVSFYVSLKKVRKRVLLKKFVSDSSVSFCVTLRKKNLP